MKWTSLWKGSRYTARSPSAQLRELVLGGATEHLLKVGREGVTRTGWLTIQAILSYKTPQPNIRTPLPST
ncbi:hypothetical protein ACE3MS_26595 [Paenibacillus dendritiformis]|uniref:hypothetical protein n=1 Tax=Paenibacillus TaxID=44249 RepID=UPI00105A3E66|nr:hypothetical protein [Paenibacillus dendritiformis]TDL53874.1 hypothetical protein E2R60_12610 [Paenibacillus dendritiformis]